jgi:hypothetical protein
VLLDELRAREQPQTDPFSLEPAKPAPPPDVAAVVREKAPIAKDEAESPRFRVGAALLGAGKELPRASLGAALRFDWLAARWFALSWWSRGLFALRDVPIADEGSVRTQAFSSALLACVPWSARSLLRAGACLGPDLGLERAASRHIARAESALLFTYGALPRLDLGFSVTPRWQLDMHGFALLRPLDKRFVYRDEGERAQAYVLSRWGVGASLGVSRAF